jgi:hypothetical protein
MALERSEQRREMVTVALIQFLQLRTHNRYREAIAAIQLRDTMYLQM